MMSFLFGVNASGVHCISLPDAILRDIPTRAGQQSVISGERTLADFFERVEPFGAAFMALFGRRCLPHRTTLSRFLSAVDRPCLEAFRTLFEQQSFAQGWASKTIGGIFDRQNCRSIVFDVDATRQAA